ncbi:ABC transporter permease [Chitinophaga pendula]|uniref:ABC transporter permease n=1 Tax=Chitinophaga TaxID=79328 RepID=UPI000BAFB4D4|nr:MULTISPECIES: ABC transporter permease [Chitinophaga]ASZ09794.1 ABC transporter permease [Chitinophaga sp. MD30]UCJ07266.1 ABC transporter permease [Chitinophaga pendula]
MDKIWLIIKREFLTRVRKKSFLILTILIPIFFAGLIIVPILIASKGEENKRIAVIDDSGLFAGHLADKKGLYFKFVHAGIDTFKTNYPEYGYAGVLYIPGINIERPSGIAYYSSGQVSITIEGVLTRGVNDVIRDRRMEKAGIDHDKLEQTRAEVNIDFRAGGEEKKKGNSAIAYIVGYISGFIIYIILMIFGMSVMRGVMEEKVSRIAEVVMSSVKPFQLMMGKIVGIAAVGLLQFMIWGILIVALQLLLPLFISPEVLQAASQANVAQTAAANNSAMVEAIEKVSYLIDSVNWTLIISCFIFYFLGGYLFYSALFAAVGSLVNEDASDVQGLTFPITLPIIIGIMIMITSVQNPDSPLAVWGSIIPFTSPMVMMARLPYGVPGTVTYWQLGLSMLLLVAGFLLTTWLAGKIYRTGILMYGKKITFKEALRWAVKKN